MRTFCPVTVQVIFVTERWPPYVDVQVPLFAAGLGGAPASFAAPASASIGTGGSPPGGPGSIGARAGAADDGASGEPSGPAPLLAGVSSAFGSDSTIESSARM